MTQLKFDNLDFTLKAIYLAHKGRFISDRFSGTTLISLYALDNFFVESHYNMEAGDVEHIGIIEGNLILG